MKSTTNGILKSIPQTPKKQLHISELLFKWCVAVENNTVSNSILNETEGTWSLKEFIISASELSTNLNYYVLDEMVAQDDVKDKEQFIRLIQLLIVRLLNSLSALQVHTEASDNDLRQLKDLTYQLLKALLFVKQYFSSCFNNNEPAPLQLVNIHKKEIQKQTKELHEKWIALGNGESRLNGLVLNCFADMHELKGRSITFDEIDYEKSLLTELKNINGNENELAAVLYSYNFNHSAVITSEFERLNLHLTNLHSKQERVFFLRSELKRINQLPVKINHAFNREMPSIHEQISTWILEEIKYCEAGITSYPANSGPGGLESKIHTTLSVAKLGLLIRLLVVDKIIINPAVAPMLRTVSKVFTTLQREEISTGSLETKYHAPDKAAINTVKEMLQKWIMLLGKL